MKYLKSEYDLREYKKMHGVFLMVLLRIADYLQIQPERAVQELLQVQSLRSPLSQGEWKLHHVIRDIRSTGHDPEAIFIDAIPGDVATYFKLKDLLSGLQEEMDTSWAILGEVYGRWPQFKELGITLRRVRSSLDDEEQFRRKISYVPRRASFEVSGGGLIPLLVSPLYGDDPALGLRELIQNAVDAVRERKVLDAILGTDGRVTHTLDVSVSVHQERDKSWRLVIADNGIGMTADIVCDYFLKVGASFRQSDAWKKLFEDEKGKPRVLSTGRFGFGGLAAFLLGDQLEVTTRHVTARKDEGLRFTASLSADSIDLWKCECLVGTRIEIPLRDGVYPRLLAKENETPGAFNWYCLNDPHVEITIQDRQIKPHYRLPGPGALSAGWVHLETKEFDNVQWTYSEVPKFVYNGMIIKSGVHTPYIFNSEQVVIAYPRLSVFDSRGLLSFDLQKKFLVGELPFEKDLLVEVVKDVTACLLVNLTDSPIGADARLRNWWTSWRHPALQRKAKLCSSFITSEGIALLDPAHLRRVAGSRLLVLPFYDENFPINTPDLLTQDPLLAAFDLDYESVEKQLDLVIEDLESLALQVSGIRAVVALEGRDSPDVLFPSHRLEFQTKTSLLRPVDLAASNGRNTTSSYERYVFEWGSCQSSELTANASALGPALGPNRLGKPQPHLQLVEVFFDNREMPASTPLGKLWRENIGDIVVPFDPEKRRRRFADTFESLQSYVNVYLRGERKLRSTFEFPGFTHWFWATGENVE